MTISVFKQRISIAVSRSLKPAWVSVQWLLKMMIPITLIVSILNYIGVVHAISSFATPLFNLLGLDGRAALVFVTSILTNIYSAIGVAASLGLDYRSVTILATMCLMAHNLIIESTIQKKTGASATAITLFRILSALSAGFLLNRILPESFSGTLLLPTSLSQPTSVSELFINWLQVTLPLSIQIFIVIICLYILQNILKEFKIINYLTRPLHPLMTVLGLPHSTTFLWIVANTLGLAYGGTVLVSEIKNGRLTSDDVSLLNTSIAETHSLLEDSFLFASIGIGLFWIIIPRLVFSIVTVWAQRGIRRLRRCVSFQPTKG